MFAKPLRIGTLPQGRCLHRSAKTLQMQAVVRNSRYKALGAFPATEVRPRPDRPGERILEALAGPPDQGWGVGFRSGTCSSARAILRSFERACSTYSASFSTASRMLLCPAAGRP